MWQTCRAGQTAIGGEITKTLPSRAAQRSGRGRPSGRGRATPRVALNAVPITPASRSSPAPSRSCYRSIDLPQLRWERRLKETSPPAQRSAVGGVGRRPGEGHAAGGTLRRTKNTRNPPFTSPLPILLSLDRPPPALLGEEVKKNLPSRAAKRSGRGRPKAGGGPRRGWHSTPYQ